MKILEHEQTPKTLCPFVYSSVVLAGAVFVLLPERDNCFNSRLARVRRAATMRNARFIGMTSGLIQFLIEDVPDTLKKTTLAFAGEIAAATQNQAVIAWTVQRCEVGCWGDDASVTYGALVPKFQQIITAVGAAKPGQIIKIS